MEGPFLPIPVQPNRGRAIGRVEAVAPHPKRAQDTIVSLVVQRADDIPGMPNFVASETGHRIDVVVRSGRQLKLRAGRRVGLTISYEGDERGGGYYANASDAELLPAE